MKRVLHSLVEPWLLHDVDFGAVPAIVADLADAGTGHPERRPVAGLLLQLDAGDVEAEACSNFPCVVTQPSMILVAISKGLDGQMALAVQGSRLPAPPTILSLSLGPVNPFALIQLRAVELVVPD